MALLEYDIRVVGMKNVEQALAGIERRIAMHNTRVARLVAGRETRPERVASEHQKLTVTGDRAAERQLKRDERTAERLRSKQEREQKALERAKQRSIAREERERVASIVRVNRVERAQFMAAQRLAQRDTARRTAFVKGMVGNASDRVGGTLRTVGAVGAGMVGVAGAGLAASAVSGATRLDESVRRVIIQGRDVGKQSKYTPEELTKTFRATATESGLNAESVAGAAAAFVTKTGDIDTAIKNMRVFATTAQATGSSIEDIASAAADMSQKLNIKSVEEMKEALSGLAIQGKKGSFELKDAAAQLPELLATAATKGVKGTKGLRQLGAMMQIGQQATGSGAETSTSIQAMFLKFAAQAEKIQSGEAFSGRKVEVYEGGDPTKSMRNFYELLPKIIGASRGNDAQLQETFDIRGVRALNPLIARYKDTVAATGGTDKQKNAAGEAAVQAMLDEFGNIRGDWSEMVRDQADAMKSTSVQLEILQSKLKGVIATEIFPEFARLAPELGKMVPYVAQATKAFVDLVKWFSGNPLKGIGLIIAGQIVKDLAAARIGSVATKAIEGAVKRGGELRMFGGPGMGSGPSSGGPGFLGKPSAGGVMGAGMTGAALGVAGALTIYASGVTEFHASEARMGEAGKATRDILNTEAANFDPVKAREAIAEQRKRVEKAQFDNSGFTGWVSNTITGGQGDVEQKTQEAMLVRMEEKFAELEKAALALKAAAEKQAAAADKTSTAADKVGQSGPNRGNTPSPVKS